MPTQKLGRLLGLTLMLFALTMGVVGVAGTPTPGDVATQEFEWA